MKMPEAIKTAIDYPIGFVMDIDVETANRWAAVRERFAKFKLFRLRLARRTDSSANTQAIPIDSASG